MGKIARIEISETAEELVKLISKQKKSKNRKRLQSLLYIKSKKFTTREELSNALGYHIRTMERWLAKYKSGGLEAMLIPAKLDRKADSISKEIHEGLESKVFDPDQGFSSYVEAQIWVKEEFGEDVNYFWLRKYMKSRFGTKIKQPRKSHIKKDSKAVEAFLKTP